METLFKGDSYSRKYDNVFLSYYIDTVYKVCSDVMNTLSLWISVSQQSITGNCVITEKIMNMTDINVHVLTWFIN